MSRVIRYSTVLYCTFKPSQPQYSTVLYTQPSAVQYSTVALLYSTVLVFRTYGSMVMYFNLKKHEERTVRTRCGRSVREGAQSHNRVTMPRRQSWASSAEPGTSWSSTLSEHLLRALSKATEAAASIPAVRLDVQRCPENAPVESFDGALSDGSVNNCGSCCCCCCGCLISFSFDVI